MESTIMRKVLCNKWFPPLAAFYILFGVWFGSLNYKVATHVEEYRYVNHIVLFPVTTIFRDGWFCPDADKSCFLPPYMVVEEKTFMGILRMFQAKNNTEIFRKVYITMITVFWLPKLLLNCAVIAFAIILSILIFVSYVVGIIGTMVFLIICEGVSAFWSILIS